jgi:hypothetical protein
MGIQKYVQLIVGAYYSKFKPSSGNFGDLMHLMKSILVSYHLLVQLPVYHKWILKFFSVVEVQVNEFYNDLSILIFGIFHIFSQISDVMWNLLNIPWGLKTLIVKLNMSAYKSFFTCTSAEKWRCKVGTIK